jgi:CheY-like chemotaxis protein
MCGVVGHPLATALQQQPQQQDCDVHGPRKPAVAPLDASPASSIHVLVVDDERLTRVVLSGLLMKCGYRVTSASDGAEALRLLRSSAPDTFQLVLTDVCMPEVNGIELLSQVKADANLRAVPVVMMSSVDQEETVAECVQYGAEEYLVKPVTKKEVQHIWQHVWRKRCAGATVPQLPPEAAAAMAAVAAAAATQQTHSEQQQSQQPLVTSQDVQQPAEPSAQQAQRAESSSSVEQLILSGPAASLQERQRVFTAAVDMVQASHLQKQALLCLRPSRLQLCQQVLAVQQEGAGGSISSSSSSEADALYSSPEEAAGQPGCPSDMFSLGLLFLDLFFPCSSQEQRLQQLRAARSGTLPAVLSGAHTAGAAQALQDLVCGLLQADPAARPSVHGVLRAGLADPFRQLEQLPHWRLAATQQAVQPAAEQPAAQQEQQAPAAEGAAPTAQPALGGAVVAVDHDAVRHFLLLLRKSKQQEVAAAQAQLSALEADIGETVRRRVGSDVASSCPAGGADTAEQPAAKRQRCGSGPAEMGAEVAAEARQRLAAALPRLEEVYFQRRGALQAAAAQQQVQSAGQADAPAGGEAGGSGKAGAEEAAHLEPFAADLQRLAARSRLGLKAALRCGDIASPTEMACCAAFDRDDEFFATVGVSRRVKIFDFRACLEGRRGGALHYPALQITTRSKLSSVSWNHYVKSQLITSDYGGLIQLWDASTAGEAAQFDEHARRVWSVDFSTTDPMRFLRCTARHDATVCTGSSRLVERHGCI